MVFIFRTGVIHLDRQVMDERLLPGRDVQLEESVQGVVDRGANVVATCNYPSRAQTHNNVRYPTVYRDLPCLCVVVVDATKWLPITLEINI